MKPHLFYLILAHKRLYPILVILVKSAFCAYRDMFRQGFQVKPLCTKECKFYCSPISCPMIFSLRVVFFISCGVYLQRVYYPHSIDTLYKKPFLRYKWVMSSRQNAGKLHQFDNYSITTCTTLGCHYVPFTPYVPILEVSKSPLNMGERVFEKIHFSAYCSDIMVREG